MHYFLSQILPIEWSQVPCRADGLDALQQQAIGSPPEGAHAVAGGLRGAGSSPLQECVQLLTACRPEELHKLEQLTGPKKVLAVFRCTSAAA